MRLLSLEVSSARVAWVGLPSSIGKSSAARLARSCSFSAHVRRVVFSSSATVFRRPAIWDDWSSAGAAGVSGMPKLSRRWRVVFFSESSEIEPVVVAVGGIGGGGGLDPGVDEGDSSSISLIVIRSAAPYWPRAPIR